MSSSDEITPTDRPLMRSDVDAIRQTVERIGTVQLQIHQELKRGRTWPPLLTVICLGCAAICIGCALGAIQ